MNTHSHTHKTLHALAQALEDGRASSRDLVEDCLARIADPTGEGQRVFLRVYADQARAQADAMDTLRRVNRAPGRYAGIPISLKDLLDVAGEPTAAGSRFLADAPVAKHHARVVQRALAAGLIPMGRTNMTEFAFSGLGLNPHYGTPRAPWQRPHGPTPMGHIPGGSSSGAAVSVADQMCFAAIGTDTGGSCRIPAAICGLVGFKPTANRVPMQGVFPLSPSLDSVGPLAHSVQCCAIMDAILAGETPVPLPAPPLAGARFLVPQNIVLNDLDTATAHSFEAALARLEQAGARITRAPMPALDRIGPANHLGGFTAIEAWHRHRPWLTTHAQAYDPRVRSRMLRGELSTAADLISLQNDRHAIRHDADAFTTAFDAVIMPTIPIAPPRLEDLVDDQEYGRINLLLLRNTAIANFLDRCAISLPCHAAHAPPCGLMLMGETGNDHALLALAQSVESTLGESAFRH